MNRRRIASVVGLCLRPGRRDRGLAPCEVSPTNRRESRKPAAVTPGGTKPIDTMNASGLTASSSLLLPATARDCTTKPLRLRTAIALKGA